MKSKVLGAVLCAIAFVSLAYGEGNGVIVLQQSGSNVGVQTPKYAVFNCGTGMTCTFSGGKFNLTSTAIAASAAWDTLTNPANPLSLTMNSNITTFAWGNFAGATPLFVINDGTTSTAVTPLLQVKTGTSSTMKVAEFCAKGTSNCIDVTNAGLLTAIGTAAIDATKLSGNLPALNGSSLTNVNAAQLGGATFAAPGTIGGTTPGNITGLTITANTGFVGPLTGAVTGNASTATSAATWTNARLLAGNSVNGSANVPFTNKFILQGTTDTGLTGAQFLGALATGLVKNTTTTGVLSIAAAADIYSLFSGSPDGTKALYGDGSAKVTVQGTTVSGRIPFSSGASTVTDSANLQYSASSGVTQTVGANNVDGYYAKRFTDTTPTGNFIRFQNNAASSDLFKVDVAGGVTATSYTSSNPSGNAGMLSLIQGTAPSDVANAINFLAPTSVTTYHITLPSAVVAGFWNQNASGALSFGALSGDATSSGLAVTVAKVNGVTYGTNPSTDTSPIVTASNTVTYTAIPDCDTDTSHASQYDTATHTWKCGAITGSAAAGGSNTQMQYNSGGAITGDADAIYTAASHLHTFGNGGIAINGATSGSVTHVATATAGGTVTWLNKTGDGAVTSSTLTNGNLSKFDASGRIIDGAIAATDVALKSGNLSQFASTTSAQLATLLSDETGSGANVFATSPVLVTPNLGTPSAITLTNATGMPFSGVTGRKWSCQSGIGDGLNAIPAGTYLQSFCYNDTGSTVTLSGLKCNTDNSGSSTMNAAGNTLGALLTGAVTCTSSFAAGTQSANVALTNGDYIKFTFVADGTSKQTTWVVTGSY